MERVYAIIPALGGTERLPRRDLKEITGDPHVGIAVSQALNSVRISEVFVNSNDDEVLDVAADYGADVRERPKRFAQRDQFMEVDRLLAWQVEQLESEGHDVDAVVTEFGVADLRGRDPRERAEALVSLAHPAYRPDLRAYRDRADGGHVPHDFRTAFDWHDRA
mgnify:CR=1 FL=1